MFGVGTNKKYVTNTEDRDKNNTQLMNRWLNWENKGRAIEVLQDYNEKHVYVSVGSGMAIIFVIVIPTTCVQVYYGIRKL